MHTDKIGYSQIFIYLLSSVFIFLNPRVSVVNFFLF